MCKKSLIRKTIWSQDYYKLQCLIPYLKGKCALIFTNERPSDIKRILWDARTYHKPKVGSISMTDIVLPRGPSNLSVTDIKLLNDLNVSFIINNSVIELLRDTLIVKKLTKIMNQKIVELLNKMNIDVIHWMSIRIVYDENYLINNFPPVGWDIDFMVTLREAIHNIQAICVETKYPSISVVPYYFAKGLNNVNAVIAELIAS